jgi:hypothetical protein
MMNDFNGECLMVNGECLKFLFKLLIYFLLRISLFVFFLNKLKPRKH